MSPPGGVGYFDVTYSSEQMRDLFAERNRQYLEFTDQHYMDLWWNNFDGRDAWIKKSGVYGFTTWTNYERVFYDTALPNIASDMYYDLYWPPTEHKTEDMARYIQNQGSNPAIVGKPWFIHVYGCDPEFAFRVMQNLPPDRYEAVCMDNFFDLALPARSQIERFKSTRIPILLILCDGVPFLWAWILEKTKKSRGQ